MAQRKRKVRYGVVGLGHIAQVAVLPAFEHAENSDLVALVSGDPEKRRQMSKKYAVPRTYDYDEYDACLAGVDAVFIALPNDMHAEYAIRAARAGVHVLCEKPMAVTVSECEDMIDTAAAATVRLMIAYRLHFEAANLEAMRIARSGELGTIRAFQSMFSMPVTAGNIRLQRERGGGPLLDLGIYCINASRAIYESEPVEVTAFATRGTDPRFREVDESVTAILRFEGDRIATFTCSFGGSNVSQYRILGTKGDLVMEPAYSYASTLRYELTLDGKTKKRKFGKRDQFAPELIHFSNCILEGREPEPSGAEGLADLRVIEAINRSIETGRREVLDLFTRHRRPGPENEIERPPIKEPDTVHVAPPHT